MNLINHQTFEMLMDRFDKVDRDVGELKELLGKHAEEDKVYYAATQQHKQYFKILWASLAGLGGLIVAGIGSIGPDFIKKLFY